ncbi:hypothetical protein JXB22_05710 [candidate division WOR-3 bacterium]|nr:hypothetical protein [candidate division WOR-3 bacterium]
MKTLLLITGCLLIFASCCEMEVEWTRIVDFAGPGNYWVSDIACIDDQTFLVGTVQNDTMPASCFLAMLDTCDVLAWHAVYMDPENRPVRGCALIVQREEKELVDNEYSIYVLVRTTGPYSTQNSILLKYRGDGTLVWTRETGVQAGEEEKKVSLLTDNSGNIFLVGIKSMPQHGTILFVTQYNTQGQQVQTVQTHAVSAEDVVVDMVDSENLVIGGVDVLFNEAFYMRYKGIGNGLNPVLIPLGGRDPFVVDIMTARNGAVYVAGAVRNSETGYDIITMCYDAHDSLLWQQMYTGSGSLDDLPVALSCDDSACVYVTGTTENQAHTSDIMTIKYGPDGDELWTRRFIGKKNESACPYSMHPNKMIRIFSVHNIHIYGTAGNDVLIIVYNNHGFLTWFKRISQDAKMCAPTAGKVNLVAVQAVGEEEQQTLLVKYTRSEQFGLNRWD